MSRRRKHAGESDENSDSEDGSPKRMRTEEDFSSYEQIRDQRIRENKERLQKLGLLELSLKLKTQNPPQNKKPRDKKTTANPQPNLSPRRSSR